MEDALTRLIGSLGTDRVVRPFEPVIAEGASADLLCVVRSGELLATVRIPGGQRVVTDYGPGAIFGVVGGPPLHTVTATRPSRVTVVEGAGLRELMRAHPTVAAAVGVMLDTARWERMRVLGDACA